MTKKATYVFFLAVSLIVPFYSWCQQPADTLDINPFEVTGHRISPTAPFKKTIIDSATLALYQSDEIADVLTERSSVFIKSYGQGTLATTSFRGTSAQHMQVFWNGISVNSPMLGLQDLSLLPVAFVDEVELHHGGASLIDGQGGLGGSLVLNNLPSWKKGWSGTVWQQFGSFGDYLTGAKASWSNGKWQSRTALYYQQVENDFEYRNVARPEALVEQQERAAMKRHGLLQEIYRRWDNGQEVGLRVMYTSSDSELPKFMLSDTNRESQSDQSVRTLLSWSKTSLKWNLTARVAHLYDRNAYQDELLGVDAENTYNASKNQVRFSYLPHSKLKLKGGIFVDYESAKTDGFPEGKTRWNQSALIGLEYNPHWRINLSGTVRQEWINDTLVPAMPALGARLQLDKKELFFLKTNYSWTYRAPTFNERFWRPGGNPDLRGEQAQTGEVGIQKTHGSGTISWGAEVTGYLAQIDNWIQWAPDGGTIWSAQNLKEVETKGIESGTEVRWTEGAWKVAVKLMHHYTEATNISGASDSDNSIGKQLLYVPQNIAGISWNVSWNNWRLNYFYRYTDTRFVTTDNQSFLPGFEVSGISLATLFKLHSGHHLGVQLKVNNLLNEEYQAIAWRPMPGRAFMATLRYQFGK